MRLASRAWLVSHRQVTASNPAHELWWRSTGLQRAMILASLNPDSLGAYHQQFVVHLDPEIDGTTWLRAAQMFLQQHGGLMARFQMRADALFTARSETPAPLGPTIDLRDEPGSPTEQLHDFLERDRARPFAILDDAPVWRSALLSLGKGERAWVWSHHHALCDNFVAPLLRGIFGVYDRLLAGAVVESEPASPDFYDYLRWRETQDWSAAQADWRERFKPGDRMTALPEVRGSLLPDDQTNRIAVNIAPETNRALRELCLRAEITLNTVVIAAWGLWLARTQEERRAIFAIMRGARKATIPGAESIFGFFTNTVPIAVPISDDISMVDWLRDVRREIVALRSLEYCSLGEIAQWTGLELGPEGPASVINFLRMGMTDELRASGLPEKRTRVSLRQTVDVPLMINACELPQLHIDILARAGFVSMATARAAARGLSAILSAIVAAPQSRLGEIDLLSEYDHAILEKAEYGPRIELLETNAHALLERQIRERPDALAIKQGARELTFAQLDELAEQVAQAIAQAGLTSDVVAV
ncbi:MAG: condensation domain-containing protein, partial [Chthoniobacterales bacterium]